jgi:acyl-CoA thioester hydrolase
LGDVSQIENLFSIQVSINYEDTDAGGVVYYGNYLGYMERVRNAFLRHHGFPLTQLIDDHHIIFVVRDVSIRYLSPARLDDELTATLETETVGGASVVFRHKICRQNECLVEAKIKLAIINSETFKPSKIPAVLKQCLSPV